MTYPRIPEKLPKHHQTGSRQIEASIGCTDWQNGHSQGIVRLEFVAEIIPLFWSCFPINPYISFLNLNFKQNIISDWFFYTSTLCRETGHPFFMAVYVPKSYLQALSNLSFYLTFDCTAASIASRTSWWWAKIRNFLSKSNKSKTYSLQNKTYSIQIQNILPTSPKLATK